MSGQTVTGLGLQFTDDNKHCWGYSGLTAAGAVQDTDYTLLEFTTNSEYILAQINFYYGDGAIFNDFRYKVKFNSVEIISYEVKSGQEPAQNNEAKPLIIPPHTIVQLTAANTEGGFSRNQMVTLVGEVGMAPRVGN